MFDGQNRTLSWKGEELNSITDAVTSANSETFTYSPSHRLASAKGAYGSLAWTYDAVGNRATQVVGAATQTYTTPTTSNQLASITQTGATTRSFGYDASGNRSSDTVGSTVLKAQYDGHGHLMTFQSGATTQGTYAYDGFARLVQRVVSNVSPAGTTQYLYDEFGHVVLETDSAGNSLREYIWLGDMPIGIIDQVNGAAPVLYYVHADHLDRPIMVTNNAGASVWQAIWTPFGAPQSITGTLTYNSRFPGQWFQIENGLNWNWNRHYDPSTGRYLQPDPMGLATLLSVGPSAYGYAGQSPLVNEDPAGLQTSAVCVLGGPYNPACDVGIAVDVIKICVAIGAAMTISNASSPVDHCYRQHEQDVDNCHKNYSFSSDALRGCIVRADDNRDLCIRGLPQVPVWKDPDVDGRTLPKPPKKRGQ